jgi:LacI family transcriptional regulator
MNMRTPEKRKRGNAQSITIRDVAAEAGVSPMTVSRVINNQNNVTDETRAVVLAAIEKLNYSPSLVARRLAGFESYRLGVLYGNPSASFLSEFMLGVLSKCRETGHQILVEQCGSSPASEKAALARLMATGVDGLILPPPLCEAKSVLAQIKESGTAMVAVAPGQPAKHWASVRIDNYKAARKMAVHLLELGHKRIGFIKGHPNQSVSNQRLKGFLNALQEASIDVEPGLIEQGYFDYRSGLAAAERLLNLSPRPTAIFAANDDMAAAVVAVATRLGIHVPRELSVAGFDDTPISSIIWPTLTTIRQPISAMGRESVALLIAEIRRLRENEFEAPPFELLSHTLIRRESTCSPPHAGVDLN